MPEPRYPLRSSPAARPTGPAPSNPTAGGDPPSSATTSAWSRAPTHSADRVSPSTNVRDPAKDSPHATASSPGVPGASNSRQGAARQTAVLPGPLQPDDLPRRGKSRPGEVGGGLAEAAGARPGRD